ncbi:MAG TPA: LysM peptidoglycan-binding domain-containing protein [Acidimicrobiales bacterium]|nr:LysM peptidoglycan-binding domain-containing protein [Acidimicrobiales bacterium]
MTVVVVAGVIVVVPLILVERGLTPNLSLLRRVASSLAHPSTLAHVWRQPLGDNGIETIVVTMAWLAWCYVSTCVVIDLVARLRGRTPVSVPGGRRLQVWIAALVGTAMAVVPAGRSSNSIRLQPVVAASNIAPQASTPISPRGPVTSVELRTKALNPEMATEVYVVRPGDTLWSIAERRLGSPMRWREIAALNRGVEQGDGAVLSTENWVLPGWELSLPMGRPASSAVVPLDVDTRSLPQTTVESGSGSGTPLAPFGYGFLGAGAVVLLDRMRRIRLWRSPTPPEPVDRDVVELEQGLRAAADHESVQRVDLGLRLLGLVGAEAGAGPVFAVRCRPRALEFMFLSETIVGAPPPFEVAGDGKSWVLDHDRLNAVPAAEAVAGRDAPVPTLVTLGDDGSGPLLVDLESIGSLGVVGSGARALLEGMVIELCSLPWAEGIEVVVVGHDAALTSFDRARGAESLSALVPEVRARVEGQRRLAQRCAVGDTVRGRWAHGGDAWDPLVIICFAGAAEADPSSVATIVDLIDNGSHGVAMVVAGFPSTTRWAIESDEGPGTLRPGVVPPGEGGSGGSLVMTVQHPPEQLLNNIGRMADATQFDTTVSVPGPGDPPRTIDVQVLGRVAVSGAAKPFKRAWAQELVVYLAMHPGGASTDQWSTALWPDRVMAPASLHSTASAARRALGMSDAGIDHLPKSHGRLALGSQVTSDWERLQILAAGSPDDWRRGLELVRGRPFDGLRSPDWVVLEGLGASVESLVVDVASRRADWCLANGDAAGAEWASRQALRASPYDERLYRILLRASDVAGNPAGVEAVMSELVRLVADDVDPEDAVHPETLELYQALSRRKQAM